MRLAAPAAPAGAAAPGRRGTPRGVGRGGARRGAAGARRAAAGAGAAGYEVVVGVETHVQLATATKAFCGCRVAYGKDPNRDVCPVCLSHPGALPVLNREVVDRAVSLCLGLNLGLNKASKFDRKQYFYPDLPKGYQISQHDVPIGEHGWLEIALDGGAVEKRLGITRAHIEEDTGKLNHVGAAALAGSAYSLADYNRAGTALIEVVSEPEMRSGAEAAEYAAEVQRIVRYLGVGNANMEEGSLRCDVNVSVRRKGEEALGTKVEVKNMNSFSAMQKAVDYEFERQVKLLEEGKGAEIVQETRLWDEDKRRTLTMRKKEGAADYRYFPEPDLPPLVLEDAAVERIRAALPEVPRDIRRRLEELGLKKADVLVLADDKEVAGFFDAAVARGADPQEAANWIIGDITAHLKATNAKISDIRLSPASLAEMVALIGDGTISGKIGKQILPELLEQGGSAKELVEAKGLVQISDEGAIEEIVRGVMAANPKQLEQYRGGKTKLRGFFVGQIMQESGGRVNPALLNQLIGPILESD